MAVLVIGDVGTMEWLEWLDEAFTVTLRSGSAISMPSGHGNGRTNGKPSVPEIANWDRTYGAEWQTKRPRNCQLGPYVRCRMANQASPKLPIEPRTYGVGMANPASSKSNRLLGLASRAVPGTMIAWKMPRRRWGRFAPIAKSAIRWARPVSPRKSSSKASAQRGSRW